jgi:hypothetical protein
MSVTKVYTFGFGHKHPVTGESLANHFAVIEGETGEHCRAEMLNHFGNAWAFQYRNAELAGVERFNLTELSWKDFPPSSDLYQIGTTGNVEWLG